jgi:hypothetical protein
MITIEMFSSNDGPEAVTFERDGELIRITIGFGSIKQTKLDISLETWRKIVNDVDPVRFRF